MAVPEPAPNEHENTGLKTVHKTRDKKDRPQTKIIVRRLPPGMDQDSFINQVSPVPDYDYIYTVKGDMNLGEHAFTRVYINFIHPEDVFVFKEKFDNYVFLDQKGHEYPAVVEFAAFQKFPKKRKVRSDPKCGSIESDPYYLGYLESLKEQPNQEEKPEYSYQFSNENKDDSGTTPLLEFVRQRRIDRQKIREERREERKRKEFERKNKYKEDERKRYEKTHIKTIVVKPNNSHSKVVLDHVKEEIIDKTTLDDFDEKNNGIGTSFNKEKLPADPKSSSKAPEEGNTLYSSSKVKTFEDRKLSTRIKPRFPTHLEKRDFIDKKSDYRSKRDDYKEFKNKHYEEHKYDTDVKQYPKKAKKYSEKREERKNEAKMLEQKKADLKNESKDIIEHESSITNESVQLPKTDAEIKIEKEKDVDADCKKDTYLDTKDNDDYEDSGISYLEREAKGGNKENDPRAQRRIKNKDRPTMAIYQPGMLSKKKPNDGGDTSKSPNEKE